MGKKQCIEEVKISEVWVIERIYTGKQLQTSKPQQSLIWESMTTMIIRLRVRKNAQRDHCFFFLSSRWAEQKFAGNQTTPCPILHETNQVYEAWKGGCESLVHEARAIAEKYAEILSCSRLSQLHSSMHAQIQRKPSWISRVCPLWGQLSDGRND